MKVEKKNVKFHFPPQKCHLFSPHQTLAMITHSMPRCHWCRKCSKNFSNTYHLRRHIRSNHVEFSKEVSTNQNFERHKILNFSFLGFELHSSHFSFAAAWWLEEIGGTPEGYKFFATKLLAAKLCEFI